MPPLRRIGGIGRTQGEQIRLASFATSLLDPAVTVAALGLVGGVVSYFWRGSAERRRTNRAVLGEIRRLLIAIKEHQHWYEHTVPATERAHYPLIPFSYAVYKKQLNNVGTLDRTLVAKAVQFYGYVDFLNTLQSLRKEHRPADFDRIYVSSLDRCVSEFFDKFNDEFEKRGIDRPEYRTPSTRESK